ncbi:MAG: DUF5060 domain-containing protein [Spartobacteria bacterium]|nr:DUF5060 domain-containing protein [Spartobacteria bacterium]
MHVFNEIYKSLEQHKKSKRLLFLAGLNASARSDKKGSVMNMARMRCGWFPMVVCMGMVIGLAGSAWAAVYEFESGEDSWVALSWDSGLCTNVQQSDFWGYGSSTGSLRMDVELANDGDKAWAGVTFAPVNLQGSQVVMRVYCPTNASGANAQSWAWTQVRLFVKDSSYNYQETPWDAFRIPPGITTQTLTHTITATNGFDSTNVTEFGLQVYWRGYGEYNGPLYIDAAGFGDVYVPPDPPVTITNTEHFYDMETACQEEWWKWDTNPEGWMAKAWTNTYYATNEGFNGSVALAADAVFVTNNSAEVVTNAQGVVTTNLYTFQKGVFEIAYEPALNLSTKDHRRLQAKLRFDPAPGDADFMAKFYVYDKISDQWYFNVEPVGGSDWIYLEFDLDDPTQYATNLAEFPSPPGPMDTSEIGFINILLYANEPWSGTVYLDEVVAAGSEPRTNYQLITSGFVESAGHKFVLDGTNFYHCGANIEYLQTVPDTIVRDCLDWAQSNHVKVVRTWAMQEGQPYSFQPERGVWNEVMFEHLDRIVAEAGHRDIRVMLALVDNWAHNGGVFQYVHWAAKEHPETVDLTLPKEGVLYHDQFWTNVYCKQWYKDYVTKLLTRTNTITGRAYKDDPTIFAWEIVNEPRCESDFTGRTIHNWLHEMSDFVRSLDTNHMLGNGQEGGYVWTYDEADEIPWEVYPDNYYHYGTYATGVSTCDLYGCGRGHGVDYISDCSSESNYVQWQGGFYTNRDPIEGEWRSGNSNINFCTARIYIDQKEYNVWRTNYNGADQRLEWINDHWYDAHRVIEKPMILEEFGIHGIGWVFNGSYGQVQLTRTPEYTFESRASVYQLFYDHIENSGIPAGYFWNYGYDGMWDDPFHLCEYTEPWVAVTTNGAATGIAVSEDHVLQGTYALKLSWDVTTEDFAVFNCPTNEKWVLRVDEDSTNEPPTHGINRTKFFWNFYNPSGADMDVALTLVGHTPAYHCETPLYTVTSGWNRIMFDLSASDWRWTSNGVVRTNYLINIPVYMPSESSNVLDDVHQVGLVFKNLPAGTGDVYIDDIQIKRDDGFVVYADDPVCPIIKAHAIRMNARNVATNDPANNVPYGTNFTVITHPVDPTPVFLNGYDADEDFLSYRIMQKPTNGWIFGSAPSNLVYKPKLDSPGCDSFRYVIHDGKVDSAEITVTVQEADFDHVRFDFELDEEDWYANLNEGTGYAVTAVVQTVEMAIHGQGALKAMVDLNGTWPYSKGDAEVNMEYAPPPNVVAPVNLNGQELSISVFCPTGARGNEANPNRIQVYAKDDEWRAIYLEETDIEEGRWITYSITVSTNTPPGGWVDGAFDPTRIRAIGVRLTHGGSGSDYEGPIFIDAASFPILGRTLYAFREDEQDWTDEDWGSGNAVLSWTNSLGSPDAGALVVTPPQGAGYGKCYIKDWDQVDNENLVWTPVMQMYIWVPCDAPDNLHHAVRASLVLRSHTDSWSYHLGAEEVLKPCQWNLMTWDMSDLPVDVLNNADEFGVELTWGNRDVWAGPVVIDSISVMAKEPEAAPEITSVTAVTNTVGRYSKYEVIVGLDNVDGLNPFDPNMVDLYATFTSPSGGQWTVNGFYMETEDDVKGQGSWRIRFAAADLGSWTYSVSVGNHMGTDTSSGHAFTCVESDRHGWIRVSDDDPRYLEHHDDNTFIGKGYCHCWDADDEGLFANCKEHGINMIHWWFAPWDTLLTVKPANPADTWREKSSYDTYEQGRAAEVDRTFEHAEKYDVKLVVTIWPHDSIRDFNHHKWRINGSWAKAIDQKFSEPEWYINAFSELDDPPMNQKFFYDPVYFEYQERLYRYIIARWGYSEAVGTWALVSELFGTFADSASCIDYQGKWATNKAGAFGEDPYENMNTNQCDGADHTMYWFNFINSYFKDNDPFGHPTTASFGTDEYWHDGFPVVDIPQLHVYADLYSWITPPVTVAKYHHELAEEYEKPSLLGEIGTVEWQLFEPDYTRVCLWPAMAAGAPITPMMWTTPAFSWFGDAKMGPWYDDMSDQVKILSDFMADIEFHKLGLHPADVETRMPNEPEPILLAGFESGMDNWSTWGPAVTNASIVTNHATEGGHALRLDINMDTYDNMPNGPSGIEKYATDGFSFDWSTNYWPRGTIKMDVYIPEFYHPEDQPDGFLLGINKDPRSILEVFTRDASDAWDWHSTTNQYGGDIRESGGWKKLTVGMLWNLELDLKYIPDAERAARVSGFKFQFGDVGILRGPIYLDNITVGSYAYNTYGMISSNKEFAFAWIQDRTWTNGFIAEDAVFQINDLLPGKYNLEWWNCKEGVLTAYNANAPTGTLRVTVPDFNKDTAVKVRRVGDVSGTTHDVAVVAVREYDWVVNYPRTYIDVAVVNQGSVSETFTVTLTDSTSGAVAGTNTVTLAPGGLTNTIFIWDNRTGPSNAVHVLTAQAQVVPGESDTEDNTLSANIKVYAQTPPWDSCNRLRRWAIDANDSDARALTVQTNMPYVSEGSESFAVYHRSPVKGQAYIGFDQVYENWSNKNALALDIYVADGSTNCALLMRVGENWVWHYSEDVTVTNGWNYDVTFYFHSNTWTRAEWNDLTEENDYYPDVPVEGLEAIQQIFIKAAGYPSEGYVYIDNIRLIGSYMVNLAYWEGNDMFPRAQAEETNYTGAACCWMIAKYLNQDYSKSQADIYAENTVDPAHNGEITPQSCQSWMLTNCPPGFYFAARSHTNLTDALKDTVYWMDFVPPAGLKSPVYILTDTNWSYKVVRGFQTDRQPYGLGGNMYTVYGMWLNDPRQSGIGYNIYASATEMEDIYLPSTTNNIWWLVAEPPEDPEALAEAAAQIDSTGVQLATPSPQPGMADYLASRFGGMAQGPAPSGTRSGGDPDLLAVLPEALLNNEAFMNAFEQGQVVSYYEVNSNRTDRYFLASGGALGPASTLYVIKLAEDGSLLQATWSDTPLFFEPLPLNAAEWAAKQELSGDEITLVTNALVSTVGGSAFNPVWELTFDVDGSPVNSIVRSDADLSGDTDGDGMSDREELYAGQDPGDALSVFTIEGGTMELLGENKVVLTWPSSAGKTYTLKRTEDLLQGFEILETSIAATPPNNSYTNTITAVTEYYRVEVE